MSASNDLFVGIQSDLKNIASKITRLRALPLPEREQVVVDHIANALMAFDSIEAFQPKREPSTEQARLDKNFIENQRRSKGLPELKPESANP